MAKIRRGRSKRLVLDIGSSSIRLCVLSQTKAGYELTKYYQREILADPSIDEETRRKERIATIKALIKEARLRTRKTILSVPGRSVFTRARTLPPVPEYKVSGIVGYEIRQQIPFPLEQISLDYQILNRTESGSYDVMMAAIKVDVVDKHLEILRETKLAIDVVDVSPFAAYNWLKHTGEFGTDGECVAMLDLGATTTEIVIERGNQFRFTRPLNRGGNDLTNALATALKVSFAEAEKFKRERAFAPTGDPARDGKMGEVLGPALSNLATDISRSFAYFRSLPGGGMVDRVVVTGGGACLRNMIPFLQRQLGIEVRIARPLAGVAIGANAQQANEHPEQACVALGMALRCCEKTAIEINLIPPRILEAARRKEQALYWVLSFVTLAMIAASIIPARDQKDKQVVARIDKLKQIISMYDPEVAANPDIESGYETQLKEVRAEIEKYIGKLTALNNNYTKARYYLSDLKLLNDLRPEGGKIWFSSVETTVISKAVPGAAGSESGRGLGMSGRANRPDLLGIVSTGFSGISGGNTGAGAGRMGGFGRRGDEAPNQKAAGQPQPVPIPNGFRIMGYAKDPDSLMEFIDRLKKHEGAPKIHGVWFSEANAEPVPITEMDMARVADRAVVRQASGPSPDEEGGSRGFGRADIGAARRTPTTPNPYAAYVETVVFFRLDLQLQPFPAPPAAPQTAAPALSAFGSKLGKNAAADKDGADPKSKDKDGADAGEEKAKGAFGGLKGKSKSGAADLGADEN